MILMVVEADIIGFATSEQRTTVPFKHMLTELIDNVEIRGSSLSRHSRKSEYGRIHFTLFPLIVIATVYDHGVGYNFCGYALIINLEDTPS